MMALPGWRQPYGALEAPFWTDPRREVSLREAVYELLGEAPRTLDELAAGVREHWGEASAAEIQAQLRELIVDRDAVRTVDGYARREA